MMDRMWAGMVLVSCAAGLLGGRGEALSTAIFDGCERALSMTMTMLGVAGFWNGLMAIARESGALGRFSRCLSPLIRRLFPSVRRGSEAEEAIAAGLTAEIFGIAGASTPLGLKAMELLAREAPQGVASRDMMTLVLLNTASVQVVPATVVAIRRAAGSAAPFAIMPAVWLTSLLTLAVGLGALWLLCRLERMCRG
ncbi:MAG: spore maturation protein A, partial [Clostridia bacterium]|nr:spore maturation protein A [Clostridia bacterium]